jgi:hypothetical protein
MSDDQEVVNLDGSARGLRDIAEERQRRIVEASRPLAELLQRDDRMVVPEQFQITNEGIYDGMPEVIYHADPVPGGSLTQSGAKLLLPPSTPAKYDYWVRHPRPTTETFDLGHAAHHMVLGIGPELVDVGFDTWKPTGKGNVTYLNAMIEEIRAREAIPLRSQDFDRVMAMAAALRAHPEAAALLDPARGRPEQAIFWTETVHWQDRNRPEEMHEAVIWRRCLIDWLPDAPAQGRLIVPDYKTTDTAHQNTWARTHVNRWGYHMQDQWITEGLQRLLGVEVAVIFILQEKDPPYLVSIAQLPGDAKEVGRARNWAALEIFAECRRTDRWPSYPTFETVSIPWMDQ